MSNEIEVSPDSKNKIARSAVASCLICLAFAIVAFAIVGYSSGYGEMVDGQVVFARESLMSHMVNDFGRDGGEWGFGYFVPLAVGLLFWIRRRDFLRTEIRPAIVCGAIVLLLGFLFYFIGFRGEQKYFGYAAGQVLALGAILWFLGWAWFRQSFWLWVLFGMMWPWRFLIEQVSTPLQLVMVKLTAGFMNLIGVDAVTNGSSVMTASTDPISGEFINMDIDVACSGMRSLFALTMIGLIFAFLKVREEWKRWVLVACVPAVAVAANFVRMLSLYGGSRIWGTNVAIGEGENMSTFHMVAGLMVFVLALIILSGIVEVLNRGAALFKNHTVVKKVVRQQP